MNSDQIILAPIVESDYEVLAQWCSSAAGMRSSGTRQFYSATELRKVIESGDACYLMVRLSSGPPVGLVHWEGLTYAGNFKVGSIIGDPKRWGAGLGAESIMLVLELLFHAYNAHRVQITAGLFNKAMVQICCAGLFRVEGVLRDYYFIDGEYHDGVVVSILRDEYYRLTKEYYVPPADGMPREEKEAAQEMLQKFLISSPIKPSDRVPRHA